MEQVLDANRQNSINHLPAAIPAAVPEIGLIPHDCPASLQSAGHAFAVSDRLTCIFDSNPATTLEGLTPCQWQNRDSRLSRALREDRSNHVGRFRGTLEAQLQTNHADSPPGDRFDSMNRCNHRNLSSPSIS